MTALQVTALARSCHAAPVPGFQRHQRNKMHHVPCQFCAKAPSYCGIEPLGIAEPKSRQTFHGLGPGICFQRAKGDTEHRVPEYQKEIHFELEQGGHREPWDMQPNLGLGKGSLAQVARSKIQDSPSPFVNNHSPEGALSYQIAKERLNSSNCFPFA